ncbi:PGAP2.2 family protein [Megaselia abdita]
MLPTYEKLNSSTKPSAKIPFGKFAIYVVSLPLFSFLFCVIWCVLFYFERSTATHCSVRNYLPSISAAIGNYQPQRFIWQLAICVHFIPRLVIAKVYLDFYIEVIRKDRMHLAKIALSLNVVENFALLVLSLWTSSEHYEIHKVSFCIFIFTSEIYMIVVYFLSKNGRRLPLATKEEIRSIRFKKALVIVNVLAFALAGFCFMRHNTRCEAGVYTLFALFEYIVVLTNMGYHMTAFWDFYGRSLCFDTNEGFYFARF